MNSYGVVQQRSFSPCVDNNGQAELRSSSPAAHMSATMTFPLIVGTSIQIDIVCGSRRASIKLATLCGPFFKRVAEICIWLSLKFYALLQDAGAPVHKEIKPPTTACWLQISADASWRNSDSSTLRWNIGCRSTPSTAIILTKRRILLSLVLGGKSGGSSWLNLGPCRSLHWEGPPWTGQPAGYHRNKCWNFPLLRQQWHLLPTVANTRGVPNSSRSLWRPSARWRKVFHLGLDKLQTKTDWNLTNNDDNYDFTDIYNDTDFLRWHWSYNDTEVTMTLMEHRWTTNLWWLSRWCFDELTTNDYEWTDDERSTMSDYEWTDDERLWMIGGTFTNEASSLGEPIAEVIPHVVHTSDMDCPFHLLCFLFFARVIITCWTTGSCCKLWITGADVKVSLSYLLTWTTYLHS